MQFEGNLLVIIRLKTMSEETKPFEGNDPNPSATEAGIPSDSAKAEEEELDAKVKENLGAHLDPVEEEKKEPEASVPEEKPKEGEDPSKEKEEPGKPEEAEVEIPPIPKPEARPSRLDRRVASLYQQNLILTGAKEVPTMEALLDDLKQYSKEEKIQALHFHRVEQKKLKGEKPTGQSEFDEEDHEAIRDAEKEAMRDEIRAEEHEKQVMSAFTQFIIAHPELDETTKEYKPTLARAVETLWRGGMPIHEAHKTVTEQIEMVKQEQETNAAKEKHAALSGAMSAGSASKPADDGKLSWEDMQVLMEKDPEKWAKLIESGYQPS